MSSHDTVNGMSSLNINTKKIYKIHEAIFLSTR